MLRPDSANSVLDIRRATEMDALSIVGLYQRVYEGTYSDPMMARTSLLKKALKSENFLWMVAESKGAIVASLIYRYDPENGLAKVYGAVVESDCRGVGLTERLMEAGYAELRTHQVPVEVVYATNRTVSLASQKITQNLGFRKLGIFPNVHRTKGYETHCLTARFEPSALRRRMTNFRLHPKVFPLYEIVRSECELLPIAMGSTPNVESPLTREIELESLQAPQFVSHRFSKKKDSIGSSDHHWFFPFHEPNLLLTSADQSVEVFTFCSTSDYHSVLIGIVDAEKTGWGPILVSASQTLRKLGARYLEFIIGADEIDKIELAIQAGFIPSAYFPAMHRSGEQRYDFVVFSRSFEILDFQNTRLEGINHKYLDHYFNIWKQQAIGSFQTTTDIA